jgi:hypothetical protein
MLCRIVAPLLAQTDVFIDLTGPWFEMAEQLTFVSDGVVEAANARANSSASNEPRRLRINPPTPSPKPPALGRERRHHRVDYWRNATGGASMRSIQHIGAALLPIVFNNALFPGIARRMREDRFTRQRLPKRSRPQPPSSR